MEIKLRLQLWRAYEYIRVAVPISGKVFFTFLNISVTAFEKKNRTIKFTRRIALEDILVSL